MEPTPGHQEANSIGNPDPFIPDVNTKALKEPAH
jgi:hypothetical protein